MENALQNLLNINVKKLNKYISGGCINSGSVYQTEDKQLLFIKKNSKPRVTWAHYRYKYILLSS